MTEPAPSNQPMPPGRQFLSLGKSTRSVHKLIVCGAQNKEDGWLFSDFMGYCMSLINLPGPNNYLSCFPLEDHFTWLKSHTPPKDDIKAGGHDGRAIYTYTSAHFRNGKHWWTQVNPDILLDQVKSWIQTKATEVEAGDFVLIYILGHCTKDDEVHIGNKLMDIFEFAKLVGTTFQKGVTTDNLFASYPFGARDDARFMRYDYEPKDRFFALPRSPSGRIRNTTCASWAIERLSTMGNGLPPVQRILPSYSNVVSPTLIDDTGPVSRELRLCFPGQGFGQDIRLLDEVYNSSPDRNGILRNLYWRGTRQAAMWELYLHLLRVGLVSPRALVVPIDIMKSCSQLNRETSTAVKIVSRFLGCFSAIQAHSYRIFRGEIPLQTTEWTVDIDWYVYIRPGLKLQYTAFCTPSWILIWATPLLLYSRANIIFYQACNHNCAKWSAPVHDSNRHRIHKTHRNLPARAIRNSKRMD